MLLADIDVPGIDAIFRQRPRHVGIFLQQQVAVVVKVADDGHADAEFIERIDDFGHRARGVFGVDGDAHQFRAGLGQRHHLIDRRRDIGGVGIGHGLHHDGMVPANLDFPDADRYRTTAWL